MYTVTDVLILFLISRVLYCELKVWEKCVFHLEGITVLTYYGIAIW